MGSARLLELLAATRPGRRLRLPAAHRTGQAQDSGQEPAQIAGNGCRRNTPEAHYSFVGRERRYPSLRERLLFSPECASLLRFKTELTGHWKPSLRKGYSRCIQGCS